MGKAAKILANYVIQKGTVKEDEREIYEYGFTVAMETVLCIIVCFVASLVLHTVLEGILFFVIFIPLRSYSGGLHLNNYWSCFSLSCLTFLSIMLLGKYLDFSIYILLTVFFLSEMVVYSLYPVENMNRTVDVEEDKHFKKRLKQFLIIDGIIAITFAALNWNKYLHTITMTLVMIAVTMAIGKCKNKSK